MRFLLLVVLMVGAVSALAQTVYGHGVYTFPGEPFVINDDVRFIVVYVQAETTSVDLQVASDPDLVVQSYPVTPGLPVVSSLPVLPDRELTLTPDAGAILKFMLLDEPLLPEATPEVPVEGDGLPVWGISPVQEFVSVEGQIASLNREVSAGDLALGVVIVGVFLLLLIQAGFWLWGDA